MLCAVRAGRYLGRISGWTLPNLELQKILYIAHMFYLGRTGRPLVSGCFVASECGPIHPELYRRAKIFGAGPVKDIFHGWKGLRACLRQGILNETYKRFASAPSGQLVGATQRKGGAWEKTYYSKTTSRLIYNVDILKEYQELN